MPHHQVGRRVARAARGRHATGTGDGFGRIAGWTVLGTLIPGSGLIAAGRRRSGIAVLTAVLLGLATAVTLALTGRLTKAGLHLAVRPNELLVAGLVLAAAGLVWAALIVATHLALRRNDALTAAQRGLSTALVLALVVAVVVPTSLAARYSFIQRDLLTTVFKSAPKRTPTAAAPEVNAPVADPWAKVPRVNLLLIGSDAGAGRTGVRPDSMVLASIDTKTGTTVLFGVPRNLEHPQFPPGTPMYRAFPRGFDSPADQSLINAVWTWAENHKSLFPGDPDPGLTATRDAVAGSLGMRVDYYVMMNLNGFSDAVDAMGGVTVTVTRRLPIGGGTDQYTGKKNKISGYIEVGRQRLNGFQALWFARSREGSDDYDRMRRQRCMIGALVSQANPAQLVKSFPALAATAKQDIETDIAQNELDAWVELALRIKDAKVLSLPLAPPLISTANVNYPHLRDLVQQALVSPSPTTASGSTSTASSPPTSPSATSPTTSPTTKPSAATPQDVKNVCG